MTFKRCYTGALYCIRDGTSIIMPLENRGDGYSSATGHRMRASISEWVDIEMAKDRHLSLSLPVLGVV